jgi:hypothetical protein
MRSRIVDRESYTQVRLVLFRQLPHNKFVIFSVSSKLVRRARGNQELRLYASDESHVITISRLLWRPKYSRYQSIPSPLCASKNCSLMRAPDGGRPLGGHTPKHNPAICITSHKTTIGSDEGRGMNLGSMATEYVSGLSGRQGHRGWLLFRAGAFHPKFPRVCSVVCM